MKNTLSKAVLIQEIFYGASNNGIPYCILRNYVDLPNSTLGGDIDLLIKSDKKTNWVNHLQSIASLHELDLGIIQKHYHGVRYCIFSIRKSIFIKLDVHYGECWRGVTYLSADHILESSINYKGYSVPSNENEAVLCLLEPLITGGKAKSRYEDIVIKSVKSNKDNFITTLSSIVGVSVSKSIVHYIDNGKYMEVSTLSNRIRRNLWFRMFYKSHGRALLSIPKYLIYEFQRRHSLLGYLLILDGTNEDIKRFLKPLRQKTRDDFPGVTISSDSVNIPHKFTTPVDSVFKQLLQSYNIVIAPYSFLKERIIGKNKFNLKKQIILTIVKDRVVIKQKEYTFDEAIEKVYVSVMNAYINKLEISKNK
jgi:hypothetical protein